MTLMLEGKMTVDKEPNAYRYSHYKSTKYIAKQIDAMSDALPQREIAHAVGWSQPAMVSMIKRGEARLPLEKVPAFARALKVDPVYLLRLVLADHHPELSETLQGDLNIDPPTRNEADILSFIRTVSNGTDPALSDEIKTGLTDVFTRKMIPA